jgi:MFS family permease
MSVASFERWGWRIPFLVSTILVVVSYYIRIRMRESPLFQRLKDEGKTSKAPIADSFGSGARMKIFFLVLLGATAGQAVVWYTGQFYALLFLQTVLKVPQSQASKIVAVALLLATPFFVVFGALSDRIGRKKIIMAGCLIAALTYIPLYHAMAAAAGPISDVADATGKITRLAQGANAPLLTFLVWIQVIYVTMVYGPIAAFLVESFPARIRYTSMSLPYHFGNGWFGGFLPLIATWVTAATGNRYAGLYYPITVSLLTVVIGTFFLKETRHVRIWHE